MRQVVCNVRQPHILFAPVFYFETAVFGILVARRFSNISQFVLSSLGTMFEINFRSELVC